MYFIRKLKPPEWNIEHKLGILSLPILLVSFLIGGVKLMFGFLALLEFIAMLIQLNMYFRTKNTGFIWLSLAFFFITVFAGKIAYTGLDNPRTENLPFIVAVIFASIIIIYLFVGKKLKWRTREILELAAMPVSDTKNGFTERPLPSGKIDGTQMEIHAFAGFMQKNLIAMPYFEDGKVIFSLTSLYSKQIGLKRGFVDESWICFNQEGNVTVFITKKDYLKYKEQLSFDQLCALLGNLFVEFFELFKHGDGVRIIDRFNALRLNPFIE
ncbi:MAG: hypothetical protein K8R37_01210 [Bacteroidales bacterium]|nr:hypothetical protein [Bacteroidales bacterium]